MHQMCKFHIGQVEPVIEHAARILNWDDASKVNYKTRKKLATHQMSGAEVDSIYPKPSLELMYRQNLSFIDPTELGYQEYPGFELEIPRLDDEK